MGKLRFKQIVSNILRYIIPLLIGGGLFYFLYNNVDIDQIMECMRSNVNYSWIVLALVISIFSHIFRALRWRLQLRALGITPPLGVLIVSIFGTYAVNLIFPRLGELWRTGYVAAHEKASFTNVFGSMVADRLTDTVTVLLITLITFLLAQGAFIRFLDTYPSMKDALWNILVSPMFWGVIVLGIILVLYLFLSKSQNKFIVKIQTIVRNLWQGFGVVLKMKGRAWFLLYTILIWGCYFTQLYVAFFAFDFTKDLGIIAALVLFTLSSISMGLPTNGGLGAWHIAIIFGLSLYGVGGDFSPQGPFDAQATTFAMVVWGAQTLLLIALGIYSYAFILLDKRK